MLISVLLPQPFGPNTEIELAARNIEIEPVVDRRALSKRLLRPRMVTWGGALARSGQARVTATASVRELPKACVPRHALIVEPGIRTT